MAQLQARVLYDFEGQPGTGELSISCDEILNVTSQDVGEGWWEGVNSSGQSGLFPASYVELMVAGGPPTLPPPPLPVGYDSYPQNPSYTGNDANDDWDDEDWDDDESTTSEQNHGKLSGQGNFGLSLPNRDVRSSSIGDFSQDKDMSGKGTVKKNLNRFSLFARSGGEAYIVGDVKVNVPDNERIHIMETQDGYVWAPHSNPYSCSIASPKKESKLKGFKSFIAYQISPSFNNANQVSRRFKQFDWLFHRLEEKFTLIPIPPLPDKQISGRYEDSFIETRMMQLQSWVNRITRHPVLSQCEVWMHFISCNDEKKWKQGKRRAEKDELMGAALCLAIEVPSRGLDNNEIEQPVEHFGKFVKSMDDSVRNLQAVVIDQIKKHTGPYKREFQKIGHSFKILSNSFAIETGSYSTELTTAIMHTGVFYDEIAKLYEDQPKFDLEPMSEMLQEYKGMLAAFPDILGIHKSAVHKWKEHERMSNDKASVENVKKRTEVVTYATLAEMNHFQHERVADFNQMMQSYLREQITFYEKITEQLKRALAVYEKTNAV